jgi:endonuclease YncB( thermonuclease family)
MSLLLAAALIVPSGEAFTCTPVRVWDGDGPLWCEEGPRLRLTGIATRELDGSCRDGQPCPDATAEAARDALVRLVGEPIGRSREGHVLVEGPPMQCVSAGRGQHDRTSAWCVSPKGGDLSCAMVEGGYALRWERFWRDHSCPQPY